MPPWGPWPNDGGGGGIVGTLPRFQLALSYGQGDSGNADLAAAESFWFQPQSVNLSPLADQIHEWPTARAVAFIGLTVFVDDATIVLTGDEPRFIVTVNGVDTIYAIALAAGAHAGELLATNGAIVINPGDRVGVRFDGSGLDAGSSLRCEMILDGAQTGTPIPPPPIPTSGLLLRLESENYSVTPAGGASHGDWTDASGNGNDVGTGGTLLIHVPTIVPAAFKTHPGVRWDRANSFVAFKVSPTWHAANAPRTIAMVLRGNDISPGTLLTVRSTVTANAAYQLSGGSSPQLIELATGGNIELTAPFVDLNGVGAVLMWWTDGGIGDPWFLSANGIEGTTNGLVTLEGPNDLQIQVGGDGSGIFFPDSLAADADFAWIGAWNRVLSVSERIGLRGNLTAEYL